MSGVELCIHVYVMCRYKWQRATYLSPPNTGHIMATSYNVTFMFIARVSNPRIMALFSRSKLRNLLYSTVYYSSEQACLSLCFYIIA